MCCGVLQTMAAHAKAAAAVPAATAAAVALLASPHRHSETAVQLVAWGLFKAAAYAQLADP
jgi:hypothetical protein